MAKNYLQSLLGKDESILFITRQHLLQLLRTNGIELLIAAVIVAGAVVAAFFYPLALLGVAAALIPLAFGLGDFLNWWNRQYVVTSRRVIQIFGIFNKNVIDSSLEKVNDVKMEQSFFGRLFDYGDLEILTASETGIDRFRRIGAPIRFKTAMLNAKEHMGQDEDRPGGGSGAGRGDIPELIAELDQLRKQGAISEAEFETKKRELLGKM